MLLTESLSRLQTLLLLPNPRTYSSNMVNITQEARLDVTFVELSWILLVQIVVLIDLLSHTRGREIFATRLSNRILRIPKASAHPLSFKWIPELYVLILLRVIVLQSSSGKKLIA